jgi:hypothetical protein
MTVVRQLDQPVQLLALLDCLALLVGAVISNNGVQRQAVTVDNRPTWVRDHTGGGVLLAGDVGGDAQVSESFSVRFHHHDRSGAMVTYCYYAGRGPQRPDHHPGRAAYRVPGLHRSQRPARYQDLVYQPLHRLPGRLR